MTERERLLEEVAEAARDFVYMYKHAILPGNIVSSHKLLAIALENLEIHGKLSIPLTQIHKELDHVLDLHEGV